MTAIFDSETLFNESSPGQDGYYFIKIPTTKSWVREALKDLEHAGTSKFCFRPTKNAMVIRAVEKHGPLIHGPLDIERRNKWAMGVCVMLCEYAQVNAALSAPEMVVDISSSSSVSSSSNSSSSSSSDSSLQGSHNFQERNAKPDQG